ncbi:MAG: TetR family transcriptional regulator [Armatimonadetes bacterium]|nr:TetR family transcriptional regulator [Armatimonadota bacterium]
MRPSKRQELLETANRIVHEEGAAALTLDAVARRSAVSKGGVLYHFPTKEALVAAMLDALDERFEAALAERATGTEPGRWLRAYVDATLDEEQYGAEVLAGLAAAIAANPRLLDPLRERAMGWQRSAVGDGVDEVTATIIRLAVDGLWFADLFNLAPPDTSLRDRVRQALHDMSVPLKGEAQ